MNDLQYGSSDRKSPGNMGKGKYINIMLKNGKNIRKIWIYLNLWLFLQQENF